MHAARLWLMGPKVFIIACGWTVFAPPPPPTIHAAMVHIACMCFNLHGVYVADRPPLYYLPKDRCTIAIIMFNLCRYSFQCVVPSLKVKFDPMLLYGMGNGNWTELFWN